MNDKDKDVAYHYWRHISYAREYNLFCRFYAYNDYSFPPPVRKAFNSCVGLKKNDRPFFG